MLLGIGRYESVSDKKLNVTKAIERLRNCFPFFGITSRWKESLLLFNSTMIGADVSPRVLDFKTRSGKYDPSTIKYLSDYNDRDTELYEAAVGIFERRVALAAKGKWCSE